LPRRVAEILRRTFWLLPGAGLAGGVLAAYVMTSLDTEVTVDLGLFTFGDAAAARSALATLATATLSVAGITFSVTLVALQLASSQLSPRVLTTFREDIVTQATLGAFLGTFTYALVLHGRLEDELPELSMSMAMFAALGALVLFVAFVARTVAALQASNIIRRIAGDGRRALRSAHPKGIGDDPGDPHAATARVEERRRALPGHELRARRTGYMLHVDGERLMRAARRHDALAVQEALLGDLIAVGQRVGVAHLPAGASPEALGELESAFGYGEERRMAGDVAFPIRALTDVALRALSPSTNDPTTAENAMGSVTDTILTWIEQETAHPIRVDPEGEPRLLARAPSIDDLVVLGFEQVRTMVEDEHPLIAVRLIAWLELIEARAARAGGPCEAARRQVELLEATAAQAPPQSRRSLPER